MLQFGQLFRHIIRIEQKHLTRPIQKFPFNKCQSRFEPILANKYTNKPSISFFTKLIMNQSPHSASDEDDLDALNDLEGRYFKARANETNVWLSYQDSCHIYLYKGGGEPNEKLAAFDLDGTIIRPKSNKRYPKSATDWDFWCIWTKVKLLQAVKAHRFVIFTNQNGIGLGIAPLEVVQTRIELVTKALNIPCTVFMATNKDKFRKPNIGMFALLESAFNDSTRVNREQSFFCGDACDLVTSHSEADIKFAEALELPFITPTKFVRGHKPKKCWGNAAEHNDAEEKRVA